MAIVVTSETISSMHAWRRQPGDALQATLDSLKLPSTQVKSSKDTDPLTEAVGACVQREAYEEAEAQIELGLSQARQASDKKKEAMALYLRVHLRALQDDREVIQELPRNLNQVRVLYREVAAKTEEEGVLKDILEWHISREDKLEVNRQKEAICSLYTEKREIAAATLRVAAVHYAMAKTVDALKLAQEALELFVELDDKDGQANALQSIAVIHLSKQELQEAVKAAEKAVEALSDKRQQALATCIIAQMNVATERFDDAVAAYRRTQSLFRETEQKDEEVEILQMLAEMQMQNGKLQEANAAGKEAVAVAHSASNKKLEVKGLQMLAHIAMSKEAGGEIDAERWATEAIAKATEAEDIEGQANAMLTMGELQLKRNDWKSAAKTANQMLDLCRGGKYRRGEATALVVLGQSLYGGEWSSIEGMMHIKESLSIFRSLRDIYGMQTANHLLANGYFVRGDLEEGLAHARDALAFYRQTGVKSGQESLKEAIEQARTMAADTRKEKPKKLTAAGHVAQLPPGPQCCPLKYSRVPRQYLDVATSSRKYWGVPRQVEQELGDAADRPPAHAVIWSYSMSDHSHTQNCIEFADLCACMAKGEVSRIPIVVQTCGVNWRMIGDLMPNHMTGVQAVTIWGMVRTIRQEIPQCQISLLDFAPSLTAAQIPRMLRPAVPVVPESAYYLGARWEPQIAQVPSIFRRDLKHDGNNGGSTYVDPKKTKFLRKSFQWTGAIAKLDYCGYRQEWKAVGPAEGEIGAMPPPPPVRSLRNY